MEEMKSAPSLQAGNKSSSSKTQSSNVKTPRVESKTPKSDIKSKAPSELDRPSRKNSRLSDTASITSEESTQNRGKSAALSVLKSPEYSFQPKKTSAGFYKF